MGDASESARSPNEFSARETYKPSPGTTSNESQGGYPQGFDPNSSAYPSQFDPANHAFSAQFDMSQPQSGGRGGGPPGPYNMGAMAGALPQSSYRPGYNNAGNHAQSRYHASAPSPGMLPQMAQYAGPPSMHPLGGQQYYMAPHAQMQPYYNNPLPASQQQANMSPRASMGYYPGQVMMSQGQQHIPSGYYYHQAGHYPHQNSAIQGQAMPPQFAPPDLRGATSSGTHVQGAYSGTDGLSSSPSNVVRGPPRKPRQSGHAIWIGNLPPQTTLMDLVHHVCNEATGLESLFLISKSNCAFANFKDEQSCVRAQQKLHDSKFQSVRLVSRLRKSTVEGTSGQTAPTGPAATSPGVQPSPIDHNSTGSQPASEPVEDGAPMADGHAPPQNIPAIDGTQLKDRFFILKSLTVEDLELSVRNEVWATQSHNEDVLNNAFKSADNVYLVFSANKSGEYFGYAKMTSPINDDPAAAIEFAPKAQTTNDVDLPKAIPTEATENCPRGRIIDDSARGTIFWEIERDEDDAALAEVDDSEDSASARSGHDHDAEGGSKAWGKPFKLQWLSTMRLPFYRTRGLRNPWNSNREVKIARDGTELDPAVGRRLISLFNRVQSPAPPAMAMGMRQGMPMVAGFPPPPMRSPFHPQS